MELACFAAFNCIQKIDRTLLILAMCRNKNKELKKEKKERKKEEINKKEQCQVKLYIQVFICNDDTNLGALREEIKK
jgi:L-cysteine desulfidase